MQSIVQALFENIKGDDLKTLPCFYDRPEMVEFRIGLSDGPQLRFQRENDELYYLILKDIAGREKHIPVLFSSENFKTAEFIYSRIRNLCINEKYQKIREMELDIMIGNLERIVSHYINLIEDLEKK